MRQSRNFSILLAGVCGWPLGAAAVTDQRVASTPPAISYISPSFVLKHKGGDYLGNFAVADFDRDGYADFALIQGGSNTVSIWLGKAGDGFVDISSLAVEEFSAKPRILAADVNADGNPDLIVTTHHVDGGGIGHDSVSVFLGDGSGSFSEAVASGSFGAIDSIAAADFNGDGRIDLVVIDSANNSVDLLLGNGTGGFTASGGTACVPAPFSCSGITAGDFNGDGKPDFAVTNSDDSKSYSINVEVFLGNGHGSFTVKLNSAGTLPFPSLTTIGDIDSDGVPDVVALNLDPTTQQAKSIAVLRGDGAGGFGRAVNYAVSAYIIPNPANLTLADLDSDGKMDLIIGGQSTTEPPPSPPSVFWTRRWFTPIAVFPGNGSGGFGTPIAYSAKGGGGTEAAGGGNSPAFAIGDYDGNGKSDVYVLTLFSNLWYAGLPILSQSGCSGSGYISILKAQ